MTRAYEHCSYPQYEEKIPAHAWGRIEPNWFFQKNGNMFCPAHTLESVADWRARKQHANREQEN